jgi:AMP-binding enzyme C-terminal domain
VGSQSAPVGTLTRGKSARQLNILRQLIGGSRLGAETQLEVEQVLLQHPDIVQAYVVGVPDRSKGEIVAVAAFAEPKQPAFEHHFPQRWPGIEAGLLYASLECQRDRSLHRAPLTQFTRNQPLYLADAAGPARC